MCIRDRVGPLPVVIYLHSHVLLFYRQQIVTYSGKYVGLAGLQDIHFSKLITIIIRILILLTDTFLH